MRIKFTKFERVAGLFVGGTLVGTLAVTAMMAVKKGWFTSKVKYVSYFESAEGLYEGTVVQMSGLRVGSVDHVDLVDHDKVKVTLEVVEKFSSKITKESYVQQVRPFIIGDKVLELTAGQSTDIALVPGAEIQSKETFDVMTILSGRKMGSFLGSLGGLTDNLKIIVEAFGDPKRSHNFIQLFDKLVPLISQLNSLTKEVTQITKAVNDQGRMEKLLDNAVSLTTEMNNVLPKMFKEAPQMAAQIPKLLENLFFMTEELKKLTPAINQMAPEFPRASRRALEALDEAVIVLKALQKSFLLSGKVKEVKEEEREQGNAPRQPAEEKAPDKKEK